MLSFIDISKVNRKINKNISRLILIATRKNKSKNNKCFTSILDKYNLNKELRNHLIRTSLYSECIADLICLNKSKISNIKKGALLHDVGKKMIDSSTLNNFKNSSIEDFKIIKEHPKIGVSILDDSDRNKTVENIIVLHHECWDGSGYPFGLSGREIPIEARVVAVANFYDNLVNHQNYQKQYIHENAILMLKEESGRRFDPDIVAIFEVFESKFKNIYERSKLNVY